MTESQRSQVTTPAPRSMIERLTDAALEYLALKEGRINPQGSFDHAGRFQIASEDFRECCRGIRAPSKSYPWSHLAHARTALHVATRHGVDPAALRRVAKLMGKSRVEGHRVWAPFGGLTGEGMER